MSEEMRAHLEMQAAEKCEGRHAAGRGALRAALRKFGGVEQVKEIARDQRTWVWVEQTLQDLRYAAGSLRRNPGFSLTARCSPSCWVWAQTTTIFTLLVRSRSCGGRCPTRNRTRLVETPGGQRYRLADLA